MVVVVNVVNVVNVVVVVNVVDDDDDDACSIIPLFLLLSDSCDVDEELVLVVMVASCSEISVEDW